MKEETKKTKKFNKKYLAFGILGIFALALVTASVLTYWKGTQIDVNVEDSFDVEEVLCNLNVVTAGDGEYVLCPFDATNNLDRALAVNFELKVQKKAIDGNYYNLVDDEGVYVGLSEDLQYAYSDEYGKCSDWNCAEAWMMDNLDWFDWYLTQEYEGYYDTNVITNHIDPIKLEESVVTIPLTNGVLEIPETVPANYEIHSVIYLGSGLNLESGDYRVLLDAVDVSEVVV